MAVNVVIHALYPGGAPMARQPVTVTAMTGPAGAALADLSVVGGTRGVALSASGTATVALDQTTVAGDPIVWRITVGRLVRHLDLADLADDATVQWGDPAVLVLEGPAPSDWVPVQGDPGVVAATGLATYDAETQTIDVPMPTASDVGAVPTARTVTAGTGLTGGGDLTADRTLAVAYGTTAGTAAEGNDARLSDARTPTAHAASHAAGGGDEITASDVGADPAGTAASAVAALPEIGAGLQESPAGFTSTVPADVADFTSSGTWPKPADVTVVMVLAVGPGGSGGSGRRGAAGTWRGGGQGGSGGAVSVSWIKASDLADTVAVTIGAAGTPGAARTTDNTDGAAAAAGTATSFGTHVVANAGQLGAGGTATSPTFEQSVGATFPAVASAHSIGFGPISYNVLGLNILTQSGGHGYCGGGGAGSWITAVNASPIAGAVGGNGIGGTGGGPGAAGNAGVNGDGGGGGGGGHAGNGGAGGFPGGGGGGGRATLNGTASGAGGLGGAGFVRVVAFR